MDIPRLDDSLGVFNAIEEIRRGVARRLEFLIPDNWQEPGTDETVVLERSGSVAETIARFAEETGADMIVVGTHGRSGLSRLVLGSTAEKPSA